MKKKSILALITAVVMTLSTFSVFALDYYVPEDAESVTARFFVNDLEHVSNEFSMVTEDDNFMIHISDDTLIYFEDYVPINDDDGGQMTRMVREVLFGRTLAEVLDSRNLRVIYEEGEYIEPISIMIMFETAVTLPIDVDTTLEPAVLTTGDIEVTTPTPVSQPLHPEREYLLVPPTSNTIYVDGEPVAFRGFNIEGNNYFMLRDLAYTLNGSAAQFEVVWDEELRAINLLSGEVYTPVGGEMGAPEEGDGSAILSLASLYINGEVVDVRAYLIGNNNFFMLRDLSDALGFSVEWCEDTASILITT